MSGIDNKRYFTLYTTLVYIIGKFLPFNFGQSKEERLHQRTSQARFSGAKMYPELVKHHVIELYHYVYTTISAKLQAAKKERKLKVFTVNLDVWKSLVSGEKYIGTCIHSLHCFPVSLPVSPFLS